MPKSKVIKKIVWAVDAFHKPDLLRKHAVEDLRNLVKGTGAKAVEPVYVLSPDQLNLALEFSSPWIEHHATAVKRALAHLVKGIDVPHLMTPKVLVQNIPSITQSAKVLAVYARRSGADLIVVSTHATEGFAGWLLTSFAETLLLHSKVPVMVVGPRSRSIRKYDHILFPSDLGIHSKASFQRVMALAKSLGAELTLFHTIRHPIAPVILSGAYLLGGGWLSVPSYLSAEEDRRGKFGESLAKIARKAGIKTNVVIDVANVGVVNSILTYAKRRKISLIAMAAHSGPVSSELIGSITWQVVRNTPSPVWVMRG